MKIIPADGQYAVKVGMRDQQTCACPQKADSSLSGYGWNAGWQMYPIRKVLYDGGLCHRQVLIIGIPLNPYLDLETIIYHKENENNPIKSWPTRLVE